MLSFSSIPEDHATLNKQVPPGNAYKPLQPQAHGTVDDYAQQCQISQASIFQELSLHKQELPNHTMLPSELHIQLYEVPQADARKESVCAKLVLHLRSPFQRKEKREKCDIVRFEMLARGTPI